MEAEHRVLAGIRPLRIVASGWALVVLDFRTESLDFLPDPIGWALVAIGTGRLALGATARLAWVAAALSLADLVLPFRYVPIDPATGEPDPTGLGPEHHVFDPIGGWRLGLMFLATVVAGLVVWVMVRQLIDRAKADSSPRSVRHDLAGARWAVVIAWVAPYLGVMAAAALDDPVAYEPIWEDPLSYLALLGLAAATWLFVLLWLHADQGWAVEVP